MLARKPRLYIIEYRESMGILNSIRILLESSVGGDGMDIFIKRGKQNMGKSFLHLSMNTGLICTRHSSRS